MTIKEARKLIAVFMVTYPNYKPIDTELAASVWADATEEYSYEQINMALKAYMKSSTSGFAPTPGQLIEKIQLMQQPQYLNEMEAWAIVKKAIGRSQLYSVEEFSKLPPLVQKAVGLPDQLRQWAITQDLNYNVVSSNFMRTYRILVEREKEISKTPSQIRAMIEKANENSDSGKIEQMRRQSIENFQGRKQEEKLLEMRIDGVEIPDRAKKRKEELFQDGEIEAR